MNSSGTSGERTPLREVSNEEVSVGSLGRERGTGYERLEHCIPRPSKQRGTSSPRDSTVSENRERSDNVASSETAGDRRRPYAGSGYPAVACNLGELGCGIMFDSGGGHRSRNRPNTRKLYDPIHKNYTSRNGRGSHDRSANASPRQWSIQYTHTIRILVADQQLDCCWYEVFCLKESRYLNCSYSTNVRVSVTCTSVPT